MSEAWDVQITVLRIGQTTLPSSTQDVKLGIQEQYVTCLQPIYQLGSHTLSTFRENLHLALLSRKAGRGGHESFRYWRIMSLAASRLFQAISPLDNDGESRLAQYA